MNVCVSITSSKVFNLLKLKAAHASHMIRFLKKKSYLIFN
jgi:hypothetical protein